MHILRKRTFVYKNIFMPLAKLILKVRGPYIITIPKKTLDGKRCSMRTYIMLMHFSEWIRSLITIGNSQNNQ